MDVADRVAEDLVLGQLLVRRVRGHQFAQLRKGPAHVLLAPPLPCVGEDLADDRVATAVQ